MQTSFPFLSAFRDPSLAPDAVVAQIRDDAHAVRVSLVASRLKQVWVAAQLGVSPGYLSLMKKGERHVPDRLVVPFCYLVGSLLLKQVREFRAALRTARG